jgi:hypothetical protein
MIGGVRQYAVAAAATAALVVYPADELGYHGGLLDQADAENLRPEIERALSRTHLRRLRKGQVESATRNRY